MKISVFGLGYVGTVTAGCLADDGHEVIGIDTNETKVALIREGRSPIIEKDIGEIIRLTAANGYFRATTEIREAVFRSEISLICVGTPSQTNGNLDLSYVQKVCEQIGAVLKEMDRHHVIVVRSTMLPGSMREVVIPTLEAFSGKKASLDFGVCNNPEFLREGSAVYDFYHPPKTVIGEIDTYSGELLASLYEKLDASILRTDVETAEMVKYTDNVWHALKVGFANEIGNICKSVGVDSHHLMDIFCQDTKLNLSSYYMKPGFAFGGSCLPKDVRALSYKARIMDLDLPIINSIIPSNEHQIDRGIRMIMEKGSKKVGILGFSFKAGTDDLRESPMVKVIEHLLGKGYDIRIYDRNVNIARLMGANRDYILNHIPHISALMEENIQDVLRHADTMVIGHSAEEFRDALQKLRKNQVVVDLVRITQASGQMEGYDGICW